MTIDQIIRDNKDRQREAEMRRGAEVVARLALAEKPLAPYHISPAERRRRDEYKKNLPNGRW